MTEERPRPSGSLPAAKTADPGTAGVLDGGPEGNKRLTVLTGLLLIVLFAALGVTIVAIGRLLWLHLFLGLVLLGPVALKLGSTAVTAVTAVHVLGRLPETMRLLAGGARTRREILASDGGATQRRRSRQPAAALSPPGRQGRAVALVVSLAGGVAIAVALTGLFAVWTR